MNVLRCNSALSSKLPLFNFPIIWNDWNSILPTCNSRWKTKKTLKSYILATYSSSVKCSNPYCCKCTHVKVIIWFLGTWSAYFQTSHGRTTRLRNTQTAFYWADYNYQPPGYGTSCQTTYSSQQVETYFVRFLKPIYLNWRIYNIKTVYYIWNVFDLYELRICFNCVFSVKRIRAISVE